MGNPTDMEITMSRFNTNRDFHTQQLVYCRRPFIANGRRYAVGDVLDWRKLSISQRKITSMFSAGLLQHKSEKPTLKPQPVEPLTLGATDDLDLIEDMKLLRQIADDEGAPYKVSKADQRQAIRDNRKGDDA